MPLNEVLRPFTFPVVCWRSFTFLTKCPLQRHKKLKKLRGSEAKVERHWRDTQRERERDSWLGEAAHSSIPASQRSERFTSPFLQFSDRINRSKIITKNTTKTGQCDTSSSCAKPVHLYGWRKMTKWKKQRVSVRTSNINLLFKTFLRTPVLISWQKKHEEIF